MSKRRISVVVNEDLYVEFVTLATIKFRAKKGCISKALEEALKLWIEQNKEV